MLPADKVKRDEARGMGLIECFTAVCLASIARMPGDRLGVVGLRRRCDVDRRHHLDVITAILNYDAEPRHLLMLAARPRLGLLGDILERAHGADDGHAVL